MDIYERVQMLEAIVAKLVDRQDNGITRGSLIETTDDKGIQQQKIQGVYGEELAGVQRWQQFGISSNCPPGGDVMVMCVGGNRDEAQIMSAEHPDHRIQNTEVGAVVVYDVNGNKVTLKAEGMILDAPTKVTINSPEVSLGGEGGPQIARIGDLVNVTYGSSAGKHPICSGSSISSST